MKIAYIPRRQRRQNIILVILLIGLPLLVFAAYQVVQITSRAGIGSEPKNVVVSNISSSMISISWTTDSSTIGYIIPVENGVKKQQVPDSRSSARSYTHYVELDGLEANTKYSFLIKSEGKEYSSSDGKNLEFSTMPIVGGLPTPGSISGILKGASNEDILVYAFLTDKSTYPVSPLGGTVSRTGGWIISINDSRNISDSTYPLIGKNTNITVIALDGRGKTAQIQGTYEELFDGNGELKPTQNFALVDGGDVYSLLPAEATLSVTGREENQTPVEPDDPTPVEPDDPTPVVPDDPTPSIPDDGSEVEVPGEGNEWVRQYRIVHQLNWVELTGTDKVEPSFTGAKTIKVVDVTDSGFKVIWISAQKERGQVNYGIDPNNLNMKALDSRDQEISGTFGNYYVHNVVLDRLQKETKYYFEVVSGENTYDNNGSKYQQSTLSLIDIPSFVTVEVIMENIPDHGEMILITYIEDKDNVGSSGRSKEISCLTEIGEDSCTIVISNSRVEDGTAFFEYTDEDLLVIQPYTTSEMEKHSKKLLGLEGAGLDIALKEISSPGVTIKVSALNDYGLTDSLSKVVNTNVGDTQTSGIPKTGITDNFWGVLILALILVVFIILLNLLSKRNSGSKRRMSVDV